MAENSKSFEQLKAEWQKLKNDEQKIKDERSKLEEEILKQTPISTAINNKPDGNHTFYGLKISTGFSRKFNNSILEEIKSEIPAELWPFKVEYKEIRKGTKYLEDFHPELWEIMREALVLRDKKPAFSLSTVKDDV